MQTDPVPQVRMRSILLVEAVFPLNHHAQVLVVQDEALHVQLLDEGCGQLLAVHQEAAISINVDHYLQVHTWLNSLCFDLLKV